MAKVTAYVYDITQGMAAQMSLPLIGKKIDLVPHTGIAVFGKEYFFGGGPQIGIPGQSVPVPVAQVLELGETSKTCEELEAYIRNVLALQHTEQNYDLLKHNCNHYADDVAKFLLDGKGLPSSIVNVAEEALSTPQGQSLRVMIENMERSMRSGGASMNPFGSASEPSAPLAAAPAPADESFGELKVALSELAKNGTEVRRTALQMLLKMTKNVEDNPSEPKFRRIKMANQAFQKKVEAATGGVDVMMAAGWLPDTNEEGEDCWLLNDSSAVKQASVRKCLDDELKKLPAPPASTAPANTGYSMPSPPAPGGLPGLGGLGGGGLPPGMANNPMMQQMMNNPGMMQQAQQMMQDPNMMAQVQQMMQNPQAMAQLQQMMGSGGLGGLGR